MSIFKTPAPDKAVRNGGSVTPMSGPVVRSPPQDPPGGIKHAPSKN
jgi:hypothetical protein